MKKSRFTEEKIIEILGCLYAAGVQRAASFRRMMMSRP
jgi:hypothetical protein